MLTNAPQLTEAQRWALQLAEAEAWHVEVEARDGSRVTLRPRPRRPRLVLYLGGLEAPADPPPPPGPAAPRRPRRRAA